MFFDIISKFTESLEETFYSFCPKSFYAWISCQVFFFSQFLILNSQFCHTAELTYPLTGNLRPDAVTYEIWFRLDQEPQKDGKPVYDLGQINWEKRKLPSVRCGYRPIWWTNHFHLYIRMDGFQMGEPVEGGYWPSYDTTVLHKLENQPLRRHKPLHAAEWHYLAWTSKDISQPEVRFYLDGSALNRTGGRVFNEPWEDMETAVLKFSVSPVTLDELKISHRIYSSEEIEESFKRGALIRDQHTLLLDHFDQKSSDGSGTVAEVISGYHKEQGGTIQGKDYEFVESKFGKGLRLIAAPKTQPQSP